MKKTFALLFGVAGALAIFTGCQTRGPAFNPRETHELAELTGIGITNSLNADLLKPGADYFTLGPGDQIQVELLGTADSLANLTVGPDGKIYFNLLPGIDVWGLTLSETKSRLEAELEKYLSSPQVTITLRGVGSKYVWLLGRLNKPGIYPTTGPMTLLEAIALAGGTAQSASQVTTEELADLRHSFVVRQGKVLPVDFRRLLRDGDMSQNISLQPDDFVYVPSALSREVYVLGAVRTPRAVPSSEQVTLVSVVTACGGTIRDAYLSHVAIVRGSLTNPKIAVVDYNDILKGRAADVRLEPQDIVYVPYSPYRVINRYLESIVATFANTVAANEGVNASGGQRVGVAVPVGGP